MQNTRDLYFLVKPLQNAGYEPQMTAKMPFKIASLGLQVELFLKDIHWYSGWKNVITVTPEMLTFIERFVVMMILWRLALHLCWLQSDVFISLLRLDQCK